MSTLHVTNGDSAAEGLSRAQLGGTVLAWRDVLHDGPLLPSDNLAHYRTVRAQFLASRGWDNAADIERDLAYRDATLDKAADEVVLWFEPDLYDQLQLVEVLERFARRAANNRPHVTIVPSDDFLGTLEVQYFAPLYRRRRAVTSEDFARAASVWKAITSGTPQDIAGSSRLTPSSVAAHSYSVSDTVRLPHLKPALQRWLEELPWAAGGINRTERQICSVLAHAPRSVAYTYHNAHHAVERWAWLGDSSYVWYLERMSDVAEPLVLFENGERITSSGRAGEFSAFFQRNIGLTEFGAEVMHGHADAIAANGIDRWFGGTHLTPRDHWRWDASQKAVEKRTDATAR